jgi:hypothetical protein
MSVVEALPAEPHALHDPSRHWSLSNCYVDLWIEVLHAWGHEPRAALPFTLTQDFEGDQFTFFKFPHEDLESCFGIVVHELAIYDSVAAHVEVQQRRGNLTLVEVDSWFLPDTEGVAYRREHTKTTIGIDRISRAGRMLGYFHNGGYHTLQGDDYDGVFAKEAAQDRVVLPPYVEVAKQRPGAPRGSALQAETWRLLRRHMTRRPTRNPVRHYQDGFDADVEALLGREAAFFHLYTFNTLRQLGANFEMLGSCLGWLDDPVLLPAISACEDIASTAKLVQFRLARMQARARRQDCRDALDRMAEAHDAIMTTLGRALA